MRYILIFVFTIFATSIFAEDTTETLMLKAEILYSSNKIVPVPLLDEIISKWNIKDLQYEKYIVWSKRNNIEKKEITRSLQNVSFDRKNPIKDENFKLLNKIILIDKVVKNKKEKF